MKKFNELSYEERKEITSLFTNWLKMYTHEAIVKVLERKDEIINNEFTMKLLIELRDRQCTEAKDFEMNIEMMLRSDELNDYNPHCHPITHSQSYRDVLYDMYIRTI